MVREKIVTGNGVLQLPVNKKGQASVETVILLAMALLILVVFIGIMWDQIFVQNEVQDKKEALFAVTLLAKEIDAAYFLGPGTVRTVNILLPESVDFSESEISGNTLLLSVLESDIVAFTTPVVRGVWPTTFGTHTFTIISYGDFVSLNLDEVSFSPRSVSVTQARSTTREFDINVVSKGISRDFTIAIDFESVDGTTMDSTFEGSLQNFVADTPLTIDLNVFCSATSIGTYFGKLVLIGDTNFSLPIKVGCVSGQTKLSLLPSTKNISVGASSVTTHTLLVCNSSQSNITSSTSTVSGSIASFSFTSFSGAITKDTCRELSLTVNAPAGTGTYLGTVSVTSGAIVAQSEVTIEVS